MFPKSRAADLNAFYGNPDANGDGRPDPKWEAANLVRIEPPYFMTWSWNDVPVKAITLHRRCAEQFRKSLVGIGQHFTPEQLNVTQLNQCGGGYNFRLMRGSTRSLSVHSWGAAIDLAPEKNWLGRAWDERLGMMPLKAVEIFADNGIRWGGLWSRPDAMHFEATSK